MSPKMWLGPGRGLQCEAEGLVSVCSVWRSCPVVLLSPKPPGAMVTNGLPSVCMWTWHDQGSGMGLRSPCRGETTQSEILCCLGFGFYFLKQNILVTFYSLQHMKKLLPTFLLFFQRANHYAKGLTCLTAFNLHSATQSRDSNHSQRIDGETEAERD